MQLAYLCIERLKAVLRERGAPEEEIEEAAAPVDPVQKGFYKRELYA